MPVIIWVENEDFSIISNEDIYNDDVSLSVETVWQREVEGRKRMEN
jgi:hypothetical protein